MWYQYVEMDTIFLSCVIITLAECGINKTLEILSTEVMTHIIENKNDFYSSFESVSKSEDEKENLIECCARYFQGECLYSSDSENPRCEFKLISKKSRNKIDHFNQV